MNRDDVRNQLNAIKLQAVAINKAVDDALVAVDQVEGTTPDTPIPPSNAQFDDEGFLLGARDWGGYRIDPIVAEGTARTVTPGETHHTLSIARPDKHERFMGYCTRVADQAHGDPQKVGALAMGADWLFSLWGGFKEDGSNWPFAADRFYNGGAYGDPSGQPGVAAGPGAPPPQPPGGGEEPL